MLKQKHVFISYKRQDAAEANALRQALRADGLTVWWDQNLQTGQRWEVRLDEALLDASAVVVLWSPDAVQSDWVKHEASVAKVRGSLTHAQIKNCQIPPAFSGIQACNLVGWNAQQDHPEYRELVNAIRRVQRSAQWKALRWLTAILLLTIGCFFAGFHSRGRDVATSPAAANAKAPVQFNTNEFIPDDPDNVIRPGFPAGWYGYAGVPLAEVGYSNDLMKNCGTEFRRVAGTQGTKFSQLCEAIGRKCKKVCDFGGKAKSCTEETPYRDENRNLVPDGSRIALCE